LSLDELINKLKEENERYKVNDELLHKLCNEIESIILSNTPRDFTVDIPELKFSINLWEGWDRGNYRKFRYITFNDRVITTITWLDITKRPWIPQRKTQIEFLRNLDKILQRLIEILRKENIEVENIIRELKERIAKVGV
jgi:hypothetical protein